MEKSFVHIPCHFAEGHWAGVQANTTYDNPRALRDMQAVQCVSLSG